MFGKRLSRALVGTTVLSLVLAVSAFADNTEIDGDNVVASGANRTLSLGDVCSNSSGSDTVSLYANRNGNYPGPQVWANSATVTFSVNGTPTSGLSASFPSGASTSLPSDWGAQDNNTQAGPAEALVTLTTGASTGSFSGTITFQGSGTGSNGGTVTRTQALTVTGNVVTCTPANTAPGLGWTAGPTDVSESGTTQHTYSFSITDPDANTWSFATATDPSCGSMGSLVAGSASINQAAKTGTFTCIFADGIYPLTSSTSTVSVAVSDGMATSSALTREVTISNVAPTVAVPAWSPTSVDCRQSATLSNISFSDPGANDNPWSLSVDFDSNATADYTDTAVATQGSYANQSTTFNTPGSYTATIEVSDKDGDTGSSSTATPLTVSQVYNVTSFYSPLDTSTSVAAVKNSFKNGRVVPVKVSLQDGCTLAAIDGNSGLTPTVKLLKTSLNGGTDAVEYFADAGQSSGETDLMRWSATDGFWIYNLDSKALGLQTGYAYRLDIYIGTIKATHTKWVYLAPTK